ncbi:MAG: hypothetical protein GWO85_00210 [Simkaniaceae bacterium]|nr:hypothetical protein [Simkaniaceae bacterium]
MKRRVLFSSILSIVFILQFGCENAPDKEPSRGDIVSISETVTAISSGLINYWFSGYELDPAVLAVYDVDVYSIVYKSINPKGELVDVSGAIYIPRSDSLDISSFPLLSVHHGTTFRRDLVASENAYNNGESLWAASNGFVVVCADGLGLGISDGLHPYMHAEGSALPVIDMLRAGRNFAEEHELELSDQVFLMGYSEGGYVTMATHKIIEETYSDEFNITASAPQAGPYDLLQMATLVINEQSYDNPGYFGYIFMAYNDIYALGPIGEIFQSPYAEKLPNLYDGSFGGGDINDSLTTIIADLFTSQFLADFLGDGQLNLKSVLRENSVINWTPSAPVRFFHGEDDKTVPYAISVAASQAMGLPLSTYEGDHGSAAVPCIEGAILWLETFVP